MNRFLCLALAPLSVVVYDPSGLIPSGPAKFVVVTVVVLLILATLDSYQPSSAAIPGALLATWLTVAALAGADRFHAIVGTPDRRFGLLTWLLVIAAVAGGSRLNERQRDALTKGSVLAGALLGMITLIQVAGWTASGAATAGRRVSGLYGQPTVLGMAGLFYGIVSLGVWRDSKQDRLWRTAGLGGLIGGACALIASGSRGPALAAVVVLVLFKARRAFIIGLVAVVLVSSTRPFSRIDEWEIGLRALADSPVLGYGPEGYRTVFAQFVTDDYQAIYGSDVFTDRAHSGLIDLALSGGIVAVALYLVALGLIARKVTSTHQPLPATAVAVLAYLVAQQALFPLLVLDPIVALSLGSLLPLTTDLTISPVRRIPLFRIPIVAFAGFVLWFGAQEIRAERELATEAATRVIDAEVVLDAVDRAPHSIRVRYVAAQLLHRNESILDLDAALDQLEAGLDLSPRDPALRLRHVELLVERAQRSGSEADAEAAQDAIAELLHDE